MSDENVTPAEAENDGQTISVGVPTTVAAPDANPADPAEAVVPDPTTPPAIENSGSAPVNDAAAQPVERNVKPRGGLENECLAVCNDFTNGDLPDGTVLTPQRISAILFERAGKTGNAPSSGAIADNLKRWAAIGFCTNSDSPLAFVEFTPEGLAKGLSAMKAEKRAERAAAAAAAKPATAPAPEPAPATGDPAPVEASAAPEAVAPESTAVDMTEVFVQSTEAD